MLKNSNWSLTSNDGTNVTAVNGSRSWSGTLVDFESLKRLGDPKIVDDVPVFKSSAHQEFLSEFSDEDFKANIRQLTKLPEAAKFGVGVAQVGNILYVSDGASWKNITSKLGSDISEPPILQRLIFDGAAKANITKTGTGATFTTDTTRLRGSHYTTNIVNDAGNFAEIGFTPITSFVPDGRVSITFWVEDVSKLSTVTVYMSDSAVYSNFITSQINMALVANKFAVSGWHTIYIDPLLTSTEGQTWATPTGTVTFGTTAINTIKVRFTPVADQVFNVSIADIIFGGKNKPSILLFFDDGYIDNLNFGAPIAEQNGLRINIPTIQSLVGSANYLDIDDLKNLQDRGHAILNHSYDNTQWGDAGAGSDVSQYISLVDSCRAFLNANGLGKYSDYFVYPGGLYVDSLVSGLRLAGYKAARGASFAGLNKTYNGNPQLDFISGSYLLDQGKTYAQVEALVNKAIDTGGHMFMHGHRLQASAGVAAWAVEDYKKLAGLLGDYLRNGLIDNPTYPEFISRYY